MEQRRGDERGAYSPRRNLCAEISVEIQLGCGKINMNFDIWRFIIIN
jgi:hypothetical protein